MSATIKRINIKQQIACVKREIKQREKVYPGLVYAGKLRQVEADWQIMAMKAVLQTLEWIELHRVDIKVFIESRKDENGVD